MFVLIFWILILLLALSFFGISIQEVFNSPAGQANIAFLLHLFDQLKQLLLPLWQWFTTYWIRPML